jgi:hypothetical protein
MTAGPTIVDRRRLLAVTAVPVAVATVGAGLIALATPASSVVIDGLPIAGGIESVAVTLLWVAMWSVAVAGAITVVAGGVDGVRGTLEHAVRRTPALLGVLLVIGAVAAAGVLVTGLAVAVAGIFALVLLLVVAFLVATMIAAVPAAVLEGHGTWASLRRSREIGRGHLWDLFWLLFAVVVAAQILAWADGWVDRHTSGAVVTAIWALVSALATAGLIALQGMWLARRFTELTQRSATQPADPTPEPDAAVSAPRIAVWRPVAIVAGAVLIVVLGAMVNPGGVPELRRSSVATDQAFALGVGVRADGTPVAFNGGEGYSGAHNTNGAFVHGDGSVTAAWLDPRELQLIECDAQTRCRSSVRYPVQFASYPRRVVVTVTPLGDVIVGAVIAGDERTQRAAEVIMLVCPKGDCTGTRAALKAQIAGGRSESFLSSGFGSFEYSEPLNLGPNTPLAIGADRQGRPVIAWQAGADRAVGIARCGDPRCAAVTESSWTVPAPAGSAAALTALGIDPDGRPVAALRLSTPSDPGFRVTLRLGSAPGPEDALVSCLDAACGRTHAVRWPAASPTATETWLAFGADGGPVILTQESGRLVVTACEHNCR